MKFRKDGVWRATRTPEGCTTTHFEVLNNFVEVKAWGPGADWALAAAPDLLGPGAADDFVAHHPIVDELHRRNPGLRIGRSNAVIEALVPTIIEQKVIGIEAKSSYAHLVRSLGEPASDLPSMAPRLVVPPSPATLAATPAWAMHRFGIEQKRADIIRRACHRANRLEEALTMNPANATRRLTAIAGIGPWTAAEVKRVALGDRDAVSIGDYNLPNQVSWVLANEPRGTDERMLELLEPYRGYRAHVIRLIVTSGIRPPRYGPHLSFSRIANL